MTDLIERLRGAGILALKALRQSVPAWPSVERALEKALDETGALQSELQRLTAPSDDVEKVAKAIRPTLHGCVDPYTKDNFEFWVDRLTNEVATRAVAALNSSAQQERAAVVAWLLEPGQCMLASPKLLADRIERASHLPTQTEASKGEGK